MGIRMYQCSSNMRLIFVLFFEPHIFQFESILNTKSNKWNFYAFYFDRYVYNCLILCHIFQKFLPTNYAEFGSKLIQIKHPILDSTRSLHMVRTRPLSLSGQTSFVREFCIERYFFCWFLQCERVLLFRHCENLGIVEFSEQIDAVIIEFSYLNVAPPADVGCSVKQNS